MFRSEAIAHGRRRLEGTVLATLPISWRWVTLALGSVVSLVVLAVSSVTLDDTISASGTIVPVDGLAAIEAGEGGIIVDMAVGEGASVEEGDRLVTIDSDVGGDTMPSFVDGTLESLQAQDDQLRERQEAVKLRVAADIGSLEWERDMLKELMATTAAQIELQRSLVRGAESALDRARNVAAKGFLTARDLQEREDSLTTRKQGLATLKQQMITHRSKEKQVGRQIDSLNHSATAELAEVSASRAELATRRVDRMSDRGYVIDAPLAGSIATISAHVGQAVQAGDSLMQVIPNTGGMIANVLVTSDKVNEIATGQVVELRIVADQFGEEGTMNGKIINVAGSPSTEVRGDRAVYRVDISLDEQTFRSRDRRIQIIPGMEVDAIIHVGSRSIWRWLLG